MMSNAKKTTNRTKSGHDLIADAVPTKEIKKPVTQGSKTVTVTDLPELTLDEALEQTLPTEDSSTETLVYVARVWGNALAISGRKTAKLGRRLGNVLKALCERTPHGEWQDTVADNFTGIMSYETVRRYIRLAEFYSNDSALKDMNIMQAYKEAAIISDKDNRLEKIHLELTAVLNELATGLPKRLHGLTSRAEAAMLELTPVDLSDFDIVLDFSSLAFSLNEAMSAAKDSIETNRFEVQHKIKDLCSHKKWADLISGTSEECIPDSARPSSPSLALRA